MEQLKLPFKFKKDEELIRKKKRETISLRYRPLVLPCLTTYEGTQTSTANTWCYYRGP